MRKRRRLIGLASALILAGVMAFSGCTDEIVTPVEEPTVQAQVQTTGAPEVTPEINEGEQTGQATYISIDVNPSIQLTIENGLVTAAEAYNDDGAQILLDGSVIGMTPDAAIAAIISLFSEQGYMAPEKEPSLVITVYGEMEDEVKESVEQQVQQSLGDLGIDCGVISAKVSSEIAQTAKNCGLTPGKYLIIKYLAEQEGITFEEAKAKYEGYKMGQLVKLVDDVDALLAENEQDITVFGALTSAQLQMLEQARAEFEAAMRVAQQAFLKAREDAKDYYQNVRDEAKEAFLADKDNEKLKTGKTEIKDGFAQAKKAALDALKQAKTQAKSDFMAAVAALGIDEAVAEQLLDWDFDYSFDFNFDFDFGDGSQGKDNEQEDVGDEQNDDDGGNGNHGKAKAPGKIKD